MAGGVLQKIERAKHHLAEGDAAVTEFWASEPYWVERVEDRSENQLKMVVRVRQEPPPALAAIAGDVVHNARSALDHLAHLLVLENGGQPTQNTCFPITKQQTGWGDTARKALRGAKHEARSAVRQVRPWGGGEEALWQLHHLDIVDKHRLLLVVLSEYKGIVIGGGEWAPWPEKPHDVIKVPELALRAKNRGPVHDGFVAYTERLDIGELTGPFADLPGVLLQLAFGEGVSMEGEVRHVLGRVTQAAEVAARQVADACGLDLK